MYSHCSKFKDMQLTPVGSFILCVLIQCERIHCFDATTLHNKIATGYQGWFDTPSGSSKKWIHWCEGEDINFNSVNVDLWPNLSEFDADTELTPVPDWFLGNGDPAYVFSSRTPSIVDKHFEWMKDYGIDSAFAQRFVGRAKTQTDRVDEVLQNVKAGAEHHDRTFAVMYDISSGSLNANETVDTIIDDWMHLVDVREITNSPNYQHHNGKPVLAIWGFGIRDAPQPEDLERLLNWFDGAENKYKVTVMGGVDRQWKQQTEWKDQYDRFDILSPWMVGRSKTIDAVERNRRNYWQPEIAELKNHNRLFMPVAFPGFSWWNLKKKEFNSVPRLGGRFLWSQMHNAVDAGASVIYVAMFDEIDEGTAIFKAAETSAQLPDVPANHQAQFLALDADGENVPTDWYLILTGYAGRMLRNEVTLTATMPSQIDLYAQRDNNGATGTYTSPANQGNGNNDDTGTNTSPATSDNSNTDDGSSSSNSNPNGCAFVVSGVTSLWWCLYHRFGYIH